MGIANAEIPVTGFWRKQMKKCENFGCSTAGKQMYQIAPGTSVWLCGKCLRELNNERVNEKVK